MKESYNETIIKVSCLIVTSMLAILSRCRRIGHKGGPKRNVFGGNGCCVTGRPKIKKKRAARQCELEEKNEAKNTVDMNVAVKNNVFINIKIAEILFEEMSFSYIMSDNITVDNSVSEAANQLTELVSGNVNGSDASVAAGYIKLKVIDQNSGEVHFRVKFGTLMGKLKKAYADRKEVLVNSIRFLFDGARLSDDDTPKKLDMVDDDVIEVFQEQIGGYQ